jgi:hypothetical protein
MKTILASVLALGLVSSAALAESTKSTATTPTAQSTRVVLTTTQMDTITAGQNRQRGLINVGVDDVEVDAVVCAQVIGERFQCRTD